MAKIDTWWYAFEEIWFQIGYFWLCSCIFLWLPWLAWLTSISSFGHLLGNGNKKNAHASIGPKAFMVDFFPWKPISGTPRSPRVRRLEDNGLFPNAAIALRFALREKTRGKEERDLLLLGTGTGTLVTARKEGLLVAVCQGLKYIPNLTYQIYIDWLMRNHINSGVWFPQFRNICDSSDSHGSMKHDPTT